MACANRSLWLCRGPPEAIPSFNRSPVSDVYVHPPVDSRLVGQLVRARRSAAQGHAGLALRDARTMGRQCTMRWPQRLPTR
jgi:hypothetical protein